MNYEVIDVVNNAPVPYDNLKNELCTYEILQYK